MAKEDFQRLLQDFREAWCRYGDKAFDIEVFAPSRARTPAAQSNPDEGPKCELDTPMFSFDEYELIAPVALPCDAKQEITSDQRDSTLFGMAVAPKRAGTAQARKVFKRLCGEAGAAIPPDFFNRLRGLVPWYMTEPAAWWLALLVALSGQSAYSSDGRYVGKAALIRPFLLSINAIQVCGLDTDSPQWPVASGSRSDDGAELRVTPTEAVPAPPSAESSPAEVGSGANSPLGLPVPRVNDDPKGPEIPRWDADRRELSFQGRSCKQFRQPAPNQTLILDAFQESGWPARIDDPLPPKADTDHRQRRADSLRGLNSNESILFEMDGTGEGILWRPKKGDTP